MPDVNMNELFNTLIGAVGGTQWAAVELLVVILSVLLGGGFLVYRRMQSSERLMLRMLDMLSGNKQNASDTTDKEKSSSKGED